MFAAHILKIEGDDVTAIEVVQYLDELEMTLRTRQEDDFLSPTTLVEKKALIRAGYAADVVLTAKCGEFFGKLFLVSIFEQYIIFTIQLFDYSASRCS